LFRQAQENAEQEIARLQALKIEDDMIEFPSSASYKSSPNNYNYESFKSSQLRGKPEHLNLQQDDDSSSRNKTISKAGSKGSEQ